MAARYEFVDFGSVTVKIKNGPDDTPLIEAHDVRPGFMYSGLPKEAYVAMQRVAANALLELVALAEASGATVTKRGG